MSKEISKTSELGERPWGEQKKDIENGICPKCGQKMWRPTPEMHWFMCYSCDKEYQLFPFPEW